MSFAAEMRDFYSGFRATSSVAGDIRDRLDKRANTFDMKKGGEGYEMFGPGVNNSKSKGVKGGKYAEPSGEIKKVIDANVPEDLRDYAYRMAFHESRYNPEAVSPTGAKGLFQFTKGTGAEYGLYGQGGDMRSDPALNAQAFVKFTEANRDTLKKSLGREPTFGELALAHQQGAGGALYLLTGKGDSKTALAVSRALKANGYDSPEGAAQKIASFYGFDLEGAGPQGDSAIPTNYTQWTAPGSDDTDVADSPAPARGVSEDDPYAADNTDILGPSRDAMNDIAAIDIPEGARLYKPGDLTEAPTLYSADGMSVPWAGETSYLRTPQQALPTYRPAQSYGPLEDLPDVADDPGGKKPRKPRNPRPNKPGKGGGGGSWTNPDNPFPSKNNEWHGIGVGWTNPDNPFPSKNNEWHGHGGGWTNPNNPFPSKNNEWHGGNVPANNPARANRKLGMTPNAGIKPNKRGGLRMAEGGAVPEDDNEALPLGSVTPAGNPRGSSREALAIDQKREAEAQKSVSTGNVIDLGLKHLTQTLGLDRSGSAVGPDPELRNNQRKLVNGAIAPNEGPPTTQEVQEIYKVVDPNGELDQGLRTIYAMKKGVEFYLQRGDTAKAGKFAAGLIQYSNLLSRRFGMEAVNAGKSGDQEGMVQFAIKAYDSIPDGMTVDAQPANGGYQVTRKDEEGNVVDQHMLTPEQIFQMATGISQGSGYFEALMEVATPGSAAANRKEKQAKERTGNLDKLLPSIKPYMDEGEAEAWSAAVEDGDYNTMNTILGNVKQRRKEDLAEQKADAREDSLLKRIEISQKFAIEQQQRGFEHSDQAAETRSAATTKAQQDREDRKAEAKKAADKDLADTYNEQYDDYATDMSEAQKKSWKRAAERGQPEVLKGIIRAIETKRGNPYSMLDDTNSDGDGTDSEDSGDVDAPAPEAIPTTPPAPAPQAATPPVTSQGKKQLPAADLANAKRAIANGADPAQIKSYIESQGFSSEGI